MVFVRVLIAAVRLLSKLQGWNPQVCCFNDTRVCTGYGRNFTESSNNSGSLQLRSAAIWTETRVTYTVVLWTLFFMSNLHFLWPLRAPEPQIIEFQSQQNKLFPALAASFGFQFASQHLWKLYNQSARDSTDEALQIMPDVSYTFRSPFYEFLIKPNILYWYSGCPVACKFMRFKSFKFVRDAEICGDFTTVVRWPRIHEYMFAHYFVDYANL